MLRKAVRMWAQGASDAQLAVWLNIQPSAVESFKSSDGWKKVAYDLRKELDFDLESSFGRLGFMALEQLEDRLTYGDFYITRGGERARRPLSADQLAKITSTLFIHRTDVRRLVDGVDLKLANEEKDRRSDLSIIAQALRSAVASGLATQTLPVIDITPTEAPDPLPEAPEGTSR
jgi:hypothetical protein